MTNPFIMAIQKNPAQFLAELDVSELKSVVEGCLDELVDRASQGDGEAPGALQALYRSVSNLEI